MYESGDNQIPRVNHRIITNISKRPNVGKRHVEQPNEGEIKERETAKEIADGK